MPDRLKHRIALVTGAGAGIGRGIADLFVQEGAVVIGADISGAAVLCDVASETAVRKLCTAIGEEHGRIDILVNCAAFASFAWIEDMTLTDWHRTLTGELDTVFVPTRAAWPWLKASGCASIVNFASANARHALEGSAALAHCAGKGGVLAMTRQLAMEGAPHGIRANTISPGFIETDATARHLQSQPALRDRVLAKNMVKRLGKPEDIGWAAVWLGSDESGYVTGADIPVDAGATAW